MKDTTKRAFPSVMEDEQLIKDTCTGQQQLPLFAKEALLEKQKDVL